MERASQARRTEICAHTPPPPKLATAHKVNHRWKKEETRALPPPPGPRPRPCRRTSLPNPLGFLSLQKNPAFFLSLFGLGQGPRSLQHLARCALRNHLEGRLLQALPELHLPPALHQFVLLRFEDVLY